MRKLLLLTILLTLTLSRASAQFAPVGAEWYHNTLRGIYHNTVDRDTVISTVVSTPNGDSAINQSCRVVKHRSFIEEPWRSYGFRLSGRQDLYIYDNTDTVFVYNILFQKFTPLYVFNVNDGDTVCLPLLPPGGSGMFSGDLGDSTFCIRIDSVRNVSYDGTTLKTVFTSPIDMPGRMELAYGTYAWKIGNLGKGLLPWCNQYCATPASDNGEGPYDVRCYHDNDISVKLVQDNCDKGIYMSVQDVDDAKQVSVYPNPASDNVTVSFNNIPAGGMQLQLCDMQGRVLVTQAALAGNNIIHTSSLPAGIYILRWQGEILNGFTKLVKH